jgi:hypothetical protein
MRLVLIVLFLSLTGCSLFKATPPAPPPSQVVSAPILTAAQDKSLSKISASNSGIVRALGPLPDSAPKAAAIGETTVIALQAGEASASDLKAAYERVDAGLRGDLASANALLDAARAEAVTDKAKIEALEAKVKAEQSAASIELQRQLAAARDEARKEADMQQRKIAAYIFYGGAFLLGAAAAVVLFTASSVPMFGPKVAIALGVAAATSALLGVTVNELLSNPWIIRTLLGLLVAAAAVAGGLAYANHHHAKPTVNA